MKYMIAEILLISLTVDKVEAKMKEIETRKRKERKLGDWPNIQQQELQEDSTEKEIKEGISKETIQDNFPEQKTLVSRPKGFSESSRR